MEAENNTRVQVPVPETREEKEEEITVKSMQEEILGLNDAGYARCSSIVMIEKIHNLLSKEPEEITDDDHEFVREVDPEYFRVKMFQFTDDIINVVMEFDSEKDAYLAELVDLFNQYKLCCGRADEQYAERDNGEDVPVPILSVTFLPYKYKGTAFARFSNPIGFFRTLDDNGKNCCLHMFFKAETADYEVVDIDEDELIDIQAGVMREQEIASGMEYNSRL